jgi:glyoxylase-like metal-dependent hydrolase (beta-lactamase superfamily II)
VIPLQACNASEWTGPTGNTTFLFTSSPSILIDAGVGHPQHLAAIESGLGAEALDLLLLTHAHTDHDSGIPALRRRWPAMVIRGGADRPLTDGELFVSGSTRLRAVHTPGHAPDHFCFLDETTGEIYCGDLVRLGGTIVIPATKGGNLRQYLQALERIRALRPTRLLPAHGPAIENPAAVIDEYLAHRKMRDGQIKDALASGCRTVDDIVARVYPGLSSSLTPAAAETVRAHLAKLREEGIG